MASDKAEICEVSETYKSCQEECYDDGERRHQQEYDEESCRVEVEHRSMGKALAHRAIYGSTSRRGRSARNLRNVNYLIKTLPSRLSKVSLADQPQHN
ncbi:hypothetical protein A4A49_34049 [Nicotiana attenuata]|uniref:Uncharacterized protein n=1 Tax=Nicotiana attenuata TaxID=49451 RepID=A0A1J6IPG2_NICAT|nr:hypothetical protein A4A49_34049 [Nicotiana attenuata]